MVVILKLTIIAERNKSGNYQNFATHENTPKEVTRNQRTYKLNFSLKRSIRSSKRRKEYELSFINSIRNL